MSGALDLVSSLVSELGQRADALPLLERKLVLHQSNALELPADGG